MNNINITTLSRRMEIEEAVTGFNTQTFYDECKSDYTELERIQYAHNRINGYSKSEAHRFIIEDREYDETTLF